MSSSEHATAVAVDDRRVHTRIAGPFDGWRVGLLDTPVRIFDLSSGGCFVNATHRQDGGQRLTLKIELPHGGWIKVKAQTLNRHGELGFPVRFLEMSDVDQRRLDRAIAGLQQDPDGV